MYGRSGLDSSIRNRGLPPSSSISSIAHGVAKGVTSTGTRRRPNCATRLEESAITKKWRDAWATTFSRSNAPPAPLIKLRSGAISSAPSIVRSTRTPRRGSYTAIPSSLARAAVCKEEATASIFSASRSYSFGKKTKKVIRRGPAAKPQKHIAADVSNGGLRDRLFLFLNLFAGLGGTHDCKHILDAVRQSSEKPEHGVEQDQTKRRSHLRRLRRSELPANTLQLARFLIGKTLVHDLPEGRISGRIVETEAYPPGDAAGHAFRGQTPRNGSLFLGRGHAYVYFAYGVYWLLNVSSEVPGVGAGVLLRALELLEGVDLVQRESRKSPRGLRSGPRTGQAYRHDASRQALRRHRSLRCRAAMAWHRGLAAEGGRQSRTHWNHARRGAPISLL